jgi:anti-sigma factor RsiW
MRRRSASFTVVRGHLSNDDLLRLRSGRLAAEEVMAMAEHLAGCAACQRIPADEAAGDFFAAIADEHEHPDVETRLFPYVDETLDAELRDDVDAHLAVCALCREDVAGLRALRRRPSRLPWIAAAAAAVAAAAILVMVVPFRAPSNAKTPAPPHAAVASRPAAPDPWHELVRSAVAAGRLDPPAVLTSLRTRSESLRGAEERRAGLRAPVGIVVENVRPRFAWAPQPGATVRVSVFAGDQLAAQSPFLTGNSWQCDRDLARGGVYSWQLEVRKGSVRSILPGAADGDALFRVLDDAAARDVAAARAKFPDDHLLAGVLYAHYGVRDRAEDELRLAGARQLLDSLRTWTQ